MVREEDQNMFSFIISILSLRFAYKILRGKYDGERMREWRKKSWWTDEGREGRKKRGG